MGLLDDAIREHLDLKRRRGADPAEVERAEREALGPVRRNRDAGGDPESDPSGVSGQHDEDRWADEPGTEVLSSESDAGGWSDEPQAAAWSEESGDEDWAYESPDRPVSTPRPTPPRLELAGDPPEPPSRSLADAGGGETIEYDVERALGSTEPAGNDDVLEETPEFLQDAPDHDRLWFEQRPPRDFDFDG
jgi:hypothetical protein